MVEKKDSQFFGQTYTLFIIYLMITNAFLYIYPIIGFYLSVLISLFYSLIVINKSHQYHNLSNGAWGKIWFILINQLAFFIAIFIYFTFNFIIIRELIIGLIMSFCYIFSLAILVKEIEYKHHIKRLLLYCVVLSMIPSMVGSAVNSYSWLELISCEISAIIFVYFLTKITGDIIAKHNIS